jgi:O-antigen/teichoic acid export membrane protein
MGLAHAVLPIIRALASPALLLWTRTLEQGRFAAVELLADGVRIVLTIALAAMLRSVWVLVAGTLIGELVRTGASYLFAALRPRWCWDRSAMRELIRFGRFILASSVLGFFAGRLDAVFVARYLGMEQAGVFYIAGVFTAVIDHVVVRVAGQVLFPVLSARQQQPEVLAGRTTAAVRLCCVLLAPGCVALALNSALLLALCYDPRYGGAAAAMQWLFVGAGLGAVAHTVNAPLLASGRPHWGTVATLARLAAFCAAAPLLGRYRVGGYAAATTLASAAFLAVLLGAALGHGYVRSGPAARAGGVFLAAVAALLGWTWITHASGGSTPIPLVPLGHAVVLGSLAWLYRRELSALLPRRAG